MPGKSYHHRVFLHVGFTILVMLVAGHFHDAYSQDAPPVKKERNWSLGGYVKYMPILSFPDSSQVVWNDHLIHNRLRFRWYPAKGLSIGVEMRNRFMAGGLVRNSEALPDFFHPPEGITRLSWNIVDQGSFILNVQFDRLWIDYYRDKWQLRIGRQRINWGLNPIWNANDIFNAFSYLDFDYEERPGTDAIRFSYFPSSQHTFEIALKPDRINKAVGAFYYKMNTRGYDLQFLAGHFRQHFAMGTGWAGNIRSVGFKGEATGFLPYPGINGPASLSASISLDYTFGKGYYVMLSGLYQSDAESDLEGLDPFAFRPSAKTLLPFPVSVAGYISRDFNPLWNANLGIFYAPTGHATLINPGIQFRFKPNWELMATAQVVLAREKINYEERGSRLFLRLKWSF